MGNVSGRIENRYQEFGFAVVISYYRSWIRRIWQLRMEARCTHLLCMIHALCPIYLMKGKIWGRHTLPFRPFDAVAVSSTPRFCIHLNGELENMRWDETNPSLTVNIKFVDHLASLFFFKMQGGREWMLLERHGKRKTSHERDAIKFLFFSF